MYKHVYVYVYMHVCMVLKENWISLCFKLLKTDLPVLEVAEISSILSSTSLSLLTCETLKATSHPFLILKADIPSRYWDFRCSLKPR